MTSRSSDWPRPLRPAPAAPARSHVQQASSYGPSSYGPSSYGAPSHRASVQTSSSRAEVPWAWQPWQGLQDLEALRQVHALEHATVWILSNHPEISDSTGAPLQDDGRLSGLSTHYGFYLYGPANTARIKWAAATALQRLCRGETELALHPRCGTNLAAQMLLTAGVALGLSSLLPKRPLEQLAGLGLSAAMAQSWSTEIGLWCQAHLTTAIPYNLHLDQVTQTHDFWGRPAHFVRVHWTNSVNS